MINRFKNSLAFLLVITVWSCSSSPELAATGEIRRFMFDDWAGPAIPAWIYYSSTIDRTNAPILVLMHGMKRAPDRYLGEWQSLADEHGLVIVAPEFSAQDFPKSAGYNLGNVFRKKSVGLQDEAVWSFSAIEPLFDYVVAAIGGNQSGYAMFGHSAGAQFAHRFMYYKPTARAHLFLLANAGWYTLPDLSIEYPYGLRNAAVNAENIRVALSRDVIILLGDQDNDPNHSSLRKTPEAMAQGPHRYARGFSFLEVGKNTAKELGAPFGWRLESVPGVAHSNSGMAKAAAPHIASIHR